MRTRVVPASLILLVLLAAGCAEVLGLEPPLGNGGGTGTSATGGTGGTGGQTATGGTGGQTGGTAGQGGTGGQTGTAGQGGTGGSTGGQGGVGGSTGGQAGAGGSTCIPDTCQSLGKSCGELDDGCGTPLSCGACGSGQICGYTVPNECGGTLRVRNGFVQSDGKKTFSQTCDVLPDGNIDCAEGTHPFTTFPLPPTGITPDAGQFIVDRFGSAVVTGSAQKLVSGFLQSNGAREWTQVCDIATGGVFNCDQASHPIATVTLPPPGLTFDAGMHTGGRYTFVFWKNGVQKYRNGFVQSDGTKNFFQDCDIAADGDLDCNAGTHPFAAFSLPPNGVTLDPTTYVSDRFAFLFFYQGAQRLANGSVQSDGMKSYSQVCDIAVDGTFGCDAATHPFTLSILPPPTIVLDSGTVTRHRYAFSYVQ